MTRTTKFLGIPLLSVASVTAIFSAGVAVGNVKNMQAQFVTRPEYTKDQHDLQTRQLRDSLLAQALQTEIIKRLDRLERINYHVACKIAPAECAR